jgi:hypothetical protein
MRAAGHPPEAIRDLAADLGVDPGRLLPHTSLGPGSVCDPI